MISIAGGIIEQKSALAIDGIGVEVMLSHAPVSVPKWSFAALDILSWQPDRLLSSCLAARWRNLA
jgi:hypothetical protein